MGVLEDAIREHLELKRRHGASDEELVRKEEEALGPARREFEATAEEQGSDEEAAPEAAAPDTAAPEALAEPELPSEPELPPEPPALQDTPPAGEPALEEPAPPPAAEPAEQEAADFAEEPADEVDQLWSEQKPSRDLDFD